MGGASLQVQGKTLPRRFYVPGRARFTGKTCILTLFHRQINEAAPPFLPLIVFEANFSSPGNRKVVCMLHYLEENCVLNVSGWSSGGKERFRFTHFSEVYLHHRRPKVVENVFTMFFSLFFLKEQKGKTDL